MFGFIKRLFGSKEIEDPNDIGTGTEDLYLLSLADIIDRLGIVDDEDDTANFYITEGLEDHGGEG